MRSKTGIVVSNAMEKTVVVRIDTYKAHPKYKKLYLRSKKVMAHSDDPCDVGDMVEIAETRPLSKNKRWRVTKILEAHK